MRFDFVLDFVDSSLPIYNELTCWLQIRFKMYDVARMAVMVFFNIIFRKNEYWIVMFVLFWLIEFISDILHKKNQ